MELSIYNTKGEDTGKKATLADEVFGITPNQHVVYLDVKQYLANQRQGTHKVVDEYLAQDHVTMVLKSIRK